MAYIKWLKWVRSTYVVTTLKKRKHNIVHLFVYVCMCCGCGCTRTGMCEANLDLAAPKKGNRSAATSCSAILVRGVGMEVGVATISRTIFASEASS